MNRKLDILKTQRSTLIIHNLKSINSQIKQVCNDMFDLPQIKSIVILTSPGTVRNLKKTLSKGLDEIVQDNLQIYTNSKDISDKLIDFDSTFLIVNDSQHYGLINASKTKYIWNIAVLCERLLLLNSDPFSSDIMNMLSQLCMVKGVLVEESTISITDKEIFEELDLTKLIDSKESFCERPIMIRTNSGLKDNSGKKVTLIQNKYFNSLGVPPGWVHTKVCEQNPKLKYISKDKNGKWHHVYTEEWHIQQEYLKILKLQHMGTSFWRKFTRITQGYLLKKGWTKDKMCSLAAAIMTLCYFRPGSTKITYNGLTTLKNNHVDVKNKDIHFKFIGKSKQLNTCTIKNNDKDNIIFNALKQISTHGKREDPLFKYEHVSLTISYYRKWLKTHFDITPKDFRTYFANKYFIKILKNTKPSELVRTERIKTMNTAFRKIATKLNNTPAVVKKSYVFSGFWVDYLTSPCSFQDYMKNNTKRRIDDILSDLIMLYKKNKIDWRYNLYKFKYPTPDEVQFFNLISDEKNFIKWLHHPYKLVQFNCKLKKNEHNYSFFSMLLI